MNRVNILRITVLGALLLGGASMHGAEPARRLITLGGSVSEIAWALGLGDHLVAVDASSNHPEAVQKLPKVGYYRMLSAEGVLALRPDLILASEEAGPPEVLEQIRSAGVKVVTIPSAHTLDACGKRILAVGQALDRGDAAAKLWADLHTRLSQEPRVLFVYARGAGTLNVAGRQTSADAMIQLAGGQNVMGAFEGYRPLTAESVVAAAPQILLLTSTGLESVGGIEGLLELPGLKDTPAGRDRRVVALDDLYLLGFGPRVADAVRDLRALFRP